LECNHEQIKGDLLIEGIGYAALVISFVLALYGAGAAAYGARRNRPELVESARRAMLLSWPMISVAALAIILLLVGARYDIEYVAKVTSNAMPAYLKITALWGGQEGSLVFWSWLMAAFASAVGLRKWDRDRDLLPWVIVVTMITLAFFLSLIIFVENPFSHIWITAEGGQATAFFRPDGATAAAPPDGQGLNPLLRHPGMIIHPPMLYLGFVAFVIPYAFAMAAMIAGRIHAVADRHRLLALRDGAGEEGHVETLEHAADYSDLLAGALRNLPDALGSAFLGACLRSIRYRPDVLRVHWNLFRHFSLAADEALE
jgi:cytochrome c biogenesis factor